MLSKSTCLVSNRYLLWNHFVVVDLMKVRLVKICSGYSGQNQGYLQAALYGSVIFERRSKKTNGHTMPIFKEKLFSAAIQTSTDIPSSLFLVCLRRMICRRGKKLLSKPYHVVVFGPNTDNAVKHLRRRKIKESVFINAVDKVVVIAI